VKKILRYLIRIAGGILLLLGIAWLLLCGYIQLNKPGLLRKARMEINRQVKGGDLQIGQLDFSFFRHFPYITLRLSNTLLRDSSEQQQHPNLLEAGNVFIRLSLFKSLFTGHVQADKLFLEHGSLYLFTDTAGHSNMSIFHSRNPGEKGSHPEFPDIALTDMHFVLDKQDKKIFFELELQRLDLGIDKVERTLNLRVNTAMTVKKLFFQTGKGSFLTDKKLSGQFSLRYHTGSKILQGKDVPMELEGHPFLFSGRFFPDVSPDPFNFTLQASAIPYQQAAELFPLYLRENMKEYAVDRPVSFTLTIDAGVADNPAPLITSRLGLGEKGDLHIFYKGPLYDTDSVPSLSRGSLDLDSLRWAPFKRNNR